MKKTQETKGRTAIGKSAKELKSLVSTQSSSTQSKTPARTRGAIAGNNALIQKVERRLVEAANSVNTIEKRYQEAAEGLETSTREMHRSNEELRQANEFLAASKQNLHAVNEELATLNNIKVRWSNELRDAQNALAVARDDAEAIVRNARNGVLILDAAMNVEQANQAFYRTFRALPSETIGRPVFELGHGLWNVPRLRELLGDILPRHSFFDNFEVTHHFDGLGERTMLLSGRILASSDGKPGKVLLEVQDVSQMLHFQAQMRYSERRYRRLFEAARDGVLIVDPVTRKILDANPFMSELLGYPHEALLGKELFEIGLLKDEEASREAFRVLQEKGFIRYEDLPLRSKSGQLREVEFVSNIYVEGDFKVIQCNIRDITERKNLARAASSCAAGKTSVYLIKPKTAADFAMKNANFTILLVEDDTNDQLLIKSAFRKIGVTDPIQTVNDGEEALAYLQGDGQFADRHTYQYPTFILMDLKMPKMDGFAVLSHLKKNPQWAIIPTVIFSASSDLDDIKQAYALGASSYHIKPGSSDEMRNQLKLLYDYWMTCEIPQVDSSGKHLPTISRGKMGERFAGAVNNE